MSQSRSERGGRDGGRRGEDRGAARAGGTVPGKRALTQDLIPVQTAAPTVGSPDTGAAGDAVPAARGAQHAGQPAPSGARIQALFGRRDGASAEQAARSAVS